MFLKIVSKYFSYNTNVHHNCWTDAFHPVHNCVCSLSDSELTRPLDVFGPFDIKTNIFFHDRLIYALCFFLVVVPRYQVAELVHCSAMRREIGNGHHSKSRVAEATRGGTPRTLDSHAPAGAAFFAFSGGRRQRWILWASLWRDWLVKTCVLESARAMHQANRLTMKTSPPKVAWGLLNRRTTHPAPLKVERQ